MQVKLASKHGFCFGVEGAIELAEKTVKEHGAGNVVALGPVIHNKHVVERLEEAGLNQSARLDEIAPGTTILIRSHGASPETLAQAEAKNLNIVDATCVLVKRAQNVVKQLHEEGYQVVMIGDKNHPEVKGVIGYAPNVIVVDSPEELADVLPKRGKLGIVAQTTHAPEHLAHMLSEIARHPFSELKVVNTLCLEVIRRQEAAMELCSDVDVMFVLGSLHSANTRELANLCRDKVDTYHLQTWEDFRAKMIAGKRVAGVTAGASTPDWIINDFIKHLEEVEPPPAAS